MIGSAIVRQARGKINHEGAEILEIELTELSELENCGGRFFEIRLILLILALWFCE
jgi:hypothetical protein